MKQGKKQNSHFLLLHSFVFWQLHSMLSAVYLLIGTVLNSDKWSNFKPV